MEYTNIFNESYRLAALQPLIFPKFKMELLDSSENAISEITQDISADSAGSISINYQPGVRRSCSITLIDKDGLFIPKSENGLFWINRKFKLYVGLVVKRGFVNNVPLLWSSSDGDDVLYTDSSSDMILASSEVEADYDIYWFSQGVFYITNPSVMRDFSNKTVTINGVDKFGIFGSELGYNQLEGTYVIPAGTNIYAAIKDILTMDLGNGTIIDPITPILDPLYINEIMPYDINKSPGSYLSEILIEIAKILGCDIFYDTDGRLNLISGTMDISYSQKASMWEYTDILPEYSGAGLNFDFVNAINVVKVMADNVNGGIIEYTAENNNPLSSTRIELIGRKVYPLINSSYIYDQARAKDYAELILKNKSIVQVTIDFNSSLLPHLDVNNVVGISDQYFDYVQQRFIMQSITMPLSTSTLMNISASNIVDLPYYDE